jgi:hypothetical protein
VISSCFETRRNRLPGVTGLNFFVGTLQTRFWGWFPGLVSGSGPGPGYGLGRERDGIGSGTGTLPYP